MEFQVFGLVGILLGGVIGWALIIYWLVRLRRYADRRWPRYAVAITVVAFFPMMLGGWLLATLLWPFIALANRRSSARVT